MWQSKKLWYDIAAMVRQNGVIGRYRADDMNKCGTMRITVILFIFLCLSL